MKKDPRPHVSVVVIGHVDSGKSTTTGHLVYKCGGIDKRTIEKFEKEAAEIGRASFRYAWVLDKTSQERNRGITIDCTTIVVPTQNVLATFIDAPGHRDFTKNMITGAAQADYALFMLPASAGEFETAVGTQGQFRQQATLAKTMGVPYGLVVVNKMDTCDFSQARYQEVVTEVADRLKRIGYRPTALAYIPISGLNGDNIMEPSPNTPWYPGWEYVYIMPDKTERKVVGRTLYDYINSLNEPPRADDKDLRGSVSDSYKIGGVGTVVVGRIESGKMRTGDLIHIAPVGVTTEVKSIEMHHKALAEAGPGDNIGFNLKNVAANEVRRGNVFGRQNANPPREVERFTAHIMVMDKIGDDRGVRVGMAPVLDCHTAHVTCRLDRIISVSEKRSKKKKDADDAHAAEEGQVLAIKKDETGMVEFVPTKPLCVEPYVEFPGLGRFSVRDQHSTIAVGVIKSVQKKEERGKQAGGAAASKPKKAEKVKK